MMNSQSSQYLLGENTTSMSAKQAWKENLRNVAGLYSRNTI